MIIVSQDKNRIINFDNILQIYITIDEDDKGCYIQYEDCNNSYEGLGKYNTEERAKEVLAEIINMYKFNRCEAVGQNNKIYKMPED